MLITPAFADSCGYWQAYNASSKCVNKNNNKHYWQYKTEKSKSHTFILK